MHPVPWQSVLSCEFGFDTNLFVCTVCFFYRVAVPNASSGRKSSRASLQEEILQRRIPETTAAAGPSSGQLLIISKTEAAAAGPSSGQLLMISKIVAAAGPSSVKLLIISKSEAAAAGHRAANFLFKRTAAGQFRGHFILNTKKTAAKVGLSSGQFLYHLQTAVASYS
jgi:hypothetical protein